MKKALFIVMACVLAGCGGQSAAGEALSSMPAASSLTAESSQIEISSTIMRNSEIENQNASSQVDEKEESRGITGSSYTYITENLKQKGFPTYNLQRIADMDCMFIPATKHMDTKTWSDLYYSISYIGVGSGTYGEILEATFSIVNVHGAENNDFIKAATAYLGLCASLPYDSADEKQVADWLNENIEKVGEGESGSKLTVGDATFELYGTKLPSGLYGMRTLSISKLEE